ncbi:hypothetical protein P7C71_g4637, partial [Lecanoromycetidae sp. Uapishka_2]
MSKRKYGDISSEEPPSNVYSDKALRLQRQQLEGLLEQGQKSLFRALKVARGFERQKLGRRQKAAIADKQDADIARLAAEVAALKSLDLAVTAESHLYKSLLKIKTIASAPSLPRHVQAAVETTTKPLDGPSANVQARLFNTGPVLVAMTEVLGGIRRVLGVEEIKAPGKKKRLRAKDYANEGLAKEDRGPLIPRNGKSLSPVEKEVKVSGRLTDQDAREGAHSETEGDGAEEGFDRCASRLAASSDEVSISGDLATSHESGLNPNSITEGDSESDIEDSRPHLTRKTPKALSSMTAPKTTTFLPSLSMGGYWSGSESAEDLVDDGPQPRKNRMGQQARRALWEKKFGKNAKHVKRQPQSRNEGWDPRRGATTGDDRGKRGRGRGRPRGEGENARVKGGGRGPMSSGANSDSIAMRKTKSTPAADASLHPSWEAAKKAKEQKKAVAFQGKKVVFD